MRLAASRHEPEPEKANLLKPVLILILIFSKAMMNILLNIPGANTSAYNLGFGLEARCHPFFLQSDLLEDLRQLHISNDNILAFLIPLGSFQR